MSWKWRKDLTIYHSLSTTIVVCGKYQTLWGVFSRVTMGIQTCSEMCRNALCMQHSLYYWFMLPPSIYCNAVRKKPWHSVALLDLLHKFLGSTEDFRGELGTHNILFSSAHTVSSTTHCSSEVIQKEGRQGEQKWPAHHWCRCSKLWATWLSTVTYFTANANTFWVFSRLPS